LDSASSGDFHLIRLLLVEPDRSSTSPLKRWLEESDHQFSVESSFGFDETKTKISRDLFDCVLVGDSDSIKIPELASTIRRASAVPIVVYGSLNGARPNEQMLGKGVDAYVLWEPTAGSTSVLANKIKFVIEKRRVDELRKGRLSSLHSHTLEILESRNLDGLSKNTLNSIETVFDADLISFLVIEGDELVCLDRLWRSRSLRLSLQGEGSIARSAREGKTIEVKDFSGEQAALEDFKPLSELIVPVKTDDTVVAIMDVRSGRPDAFTKVDAEALEVLSLYVGFAYKLRNEIESVASSGSRYRHLLDVLNDAVYVLDGSRYIYLNMNGAGLLGYDNPSELIEKDVYQHVHPDYRESVRRNIESRLRGEDVPEKYEIKLVKRDGAVIDVEEKASRIVFEGKPASLVVEKDITAQKVMEEQLRKYTEDLKQQVDSRSQELLEAQQFAAAGRMASMVGHDLRSPLQSIRNATYLLRRQPSRSEEMLASIENSVDRALAMLEELRHRTRETPLKVEPTDLPDLITDVLKDIPTTEAVEISFNLDPDLKVVEIDPLKIRRVLDNLIRNAFEAMPDGGKLTVETKRDVDHFVIKITDTGVGIPEENFQNLFKPFYTTKSKGLGLGLAYSMKAVESHNGTIAVESQVGKGTSFTIRIPLRQATEVKEATS
jgi:PAS domain S-box-containing protein